MPLAKPFTRVVVRRSAPSGGPKCHSGLSTMGWGAGVPQEERINKGWGAGDHFWRKAPENLREQSWNYSPAIWIAGITRQCWATRTGNRTEGKRTNLVIFEATCQQLVKAAGRYRQNFGLSYNNIVLEYHVLDTFFRYTHTLKNKRPSLKCCKVLISYTL